MSHAAASHLTVGLFYTRSHARSLLHAFGKCAVLQKAADMALHALLTGNETENGLSLKFTIGDDSDHFLDQLESEALKRALNGNADPMVVGTMTAAEVNDFISSLVFPFKAGDGSVTQFVDWA